MPDSQGFDQASNTTLAKLLEVDSELAVTEAELLSQLESVQEKRRSLKTVLCLFTGADTPATVTVEEPAQTPPAETGRELERVGSDVAAQGLETSKATAKAEMQTAAAPDTQSKKAKKTASSPTRRNKNTLNTKFTQTAKAAEEILGWHQYLREEFGKKSLPEAVYAVLQRGADKVFEIPAVVNAIFVDDLPKEVGSKVRRQVTNILSEGARKNKWYRGQLGYYSMSRAAAQANSSS